MITLGFTRVNRSSSQYQPVYEHPRPEEEQAMKGSLKQRILKLKRLSVCETEKLVVE